MADGTEPPKKLEKQQALERARQGKDAWNEWAAAHPGWEVDFSGHNFTNVPISFEDYVFPGNVHFSNCNIPDANFRNAKFIDGQAWFKKTQFIRSMAIFDNACFSGGPVSFSEAQFFGGASFSEVKFSGGAVWFTGVTFRKGDTWFRKAEFSGGDAYFNNAEFYGVARFGAAKFVGGDAWFRGGVFDDEAWFKQALFRHNVDFSTANFQSAVYLDDAKFLQVPDFRYTKPDRHFTLHGVDVEYGVHENRERWSGLLCSKAASKEDTDKFRRLKELAMAAKDHEREQGFFAKELKAKRFYETKGWALVWSYLYEWLSDFGRSTWRPIAALVVTWFLSGLFYWMTAQWAAVGPLKSVGDGLKLSASVLVPFVAAARTSYGEAKGALYGEGMGLWLDLFVIFEGILGLAFVFLIGLALRNRFRI